MKIYSPKIIGDIKIERKTVLPEYIEETCRNRFLYITSDSKIYYGGILGWIDLSALMFETGYDQLKLFPTSLINEIITPNTYIDNINIYDSCKYPENDFYLYPVIENVFNIILQILEDDPNYPQNIIDSSNYNNKLLINFNHFIYYNPYNTFLISEDSSKSYFSLALGNIYKIIPNIDFNIYDHLKFEININVLSYSSIDLFRIDGSGSRSLYLNYDNYYGLRLLCDSGIVLITAFTPITNWVNIKFFKILDIFYLYVNGILNGIYNIYTHTFKYIHFSNSDLYIINNIADIHVSNIKISSFNALNIAPKIFQTPNQYTKLLLKSINNNPTDLIKDQSGTNKNIFDIKNVNYSSSYKILNAISSLYFSYPGMSISQIISTSKVITGFKIDDSSDFDLGLNYEPFTIRAYIFPRCGNGTLFRKYGGINDWNLNNGIFIWFGLKFSEYDINTQKLFFYYNVGYDCIRVEYPISINEWHHVAVTYTGSIIQLYIDNILVNSTVGTIPEFIKPENCTSVHIGSHLEDITFNYLGYINNFVISKGVDEYSDSIFNPSFEVKNILEQDLLIVDINNRKKLQDLSFNPTHPYFINSKLYFNGYSNIPIIYTSQFNLKTYNFTISCDIILEDKYLDGISNLSITNSYPSAVSNYLPLPYRFSATSEDTYLVDDGIKHLAYYAFKPDNTFWYSKIRPANIMIDYGANNGKCINKYSIKAAVSGSDDLNKNGPNLIGSWKLQATNNPYASVLDSENINDWVTLHTDQLIFEIKNLIVYNNNRTVYYTFKNNVIYQKYRLYDVTCGGIGDLYLIEDSRVLTFSNNSYILSCGTNSYNYSLYISEDRKIVFDVILNSICTSYIYSNILDFNVSYNLELSRYNNNLILYLDGVSIGSYLISTNILISEGIVKIGSRYDGLYGFQGYLKNIRMYGDFVKHTSNFSLNEKIYPIIPIPNIDPDWLLATSFYPLDNGTVDDTSFYKNTITNNNSSRHIDITCSIPYNISICSDIKIAETVSYCINSYISINDNVNDWDLGINDFTIAGWINFPILNLNYEHGIISFGQNENNYFSLNYKLSTSRFIFRYLNSNDDIYMHYDICDILLNIDTWYYVALNRLNGELYFQLSGISKLLTQVGTSLGNTNIKNEYSSNFIINHCFYSEFTNIGSMKFHNIMISKGKCWFIENYIPPYSIPIDPSIVLQLQYDTDSGYIKDYSLPMSSNLTPTNTGYSGIISEYPIYISPSKNWAFLDSNFRIDFDCYFLSGSDYSFLIDYGYSNSIDGWGIFVRPAINNIVFSIRTTATSAETSFSTPASSFMPNIWNHITITRTGTYLKIYINGISKATSTIITRNVGFHSLTRQLCLGKAIYSDGTVKTSKFYITNLIISKNTKYNTSFTSYDIVPLNLPNTSKSFINVPNYKEQFLDHINMISDINYGISNSVSIFGSYTGSAKWFGGILSSSGTIYSIQHNSDFILNILPTNNFIISGITATGINKFSTGVLIYQNDIYSIPYSSDQISLISSHSNEIKSNSNILPGSNKWASSIIAPDNCIYSLPYNSDSILKINFLTSNPTINLTPIVTSGSQAYVGAVLSLDDCIYGIPYNSDLIIKLILYSSTPETKYFTYPSPISGSAKYSGGVLGPDGCIYCIPYNATQILKIIPGIIPTYFLFGDIVGSAKYSGGVLGPDGCIYCIPYNATQILKIIPGINPEITLLSESLIGSTAISKWVGGVLGFDGSIYGIPYNSSGILKISFPKLKRNFDTHILLSPYLNKF
jgi:hypothetical protein